MSKDTAVLATVITVYGLLACISGMMLQRNSDQRQLKKWEDIAFSEGCRKCAEFERLECERDKLQGVEGFTQIP